jgi:hypothetical protein
MSQFLAQEFPEFGSVDFLLQKYHKAGIKKNVFVLIFYTKVRLCHKNEI